MAESPESSPSLHAGRHLRFAWWSLLLYLSLGMVLESFHGFKLGWYLDPGNETRRLMFTLAHTHGTLLALVHAAFAAALPRLPSWSGTSRDVASLSLIASSVLLPLGFFAGGIVIYDGDPGLAILLVPPGAVMLVVGVLLTALAAQREAR